MSLLLLLLLLLLLFLRCFLAVHWKLCCCCRWFCRCSAVCVIAMCRNTQDGATRPLGSFFFPNTWFSPQRGKFKTKQRNSQATRLRKNLSDEIFPNPPSWLCASNPPWFCGKSAHKVFPGSLFVIRRVIPGTWYGVCCHGWSKSTLLEPRWIRIWQIIDSRLMI